MLNYVLLCSGIRSHLASHIRFNVSEEIFVSIFMADCYPEYVCSRFIRILGTHLSNFALSHLKMWTREYWIAHIGFAFQICRDNHSSLPNSGPKRWAIVFPSEQLDAFAILRKATISSVMFIRLSVRMEKLVSHWTDFRENWYLNIFRKSD